MTMERASRKSGWKQWTPDEARSALKAWRASGLSLSAFARKTGVTVQRLAWWQQRLGDWAEEARTSEDGALRLVPVLTSATAEVVARARAGATMRLPGGVALEFDVAQVPAQWVAQVALEVARAG